MKSFIKGLLKKSLFLNSMRRNRRVRHTKRSWIARAFDKDDTTVAMSSVIIAVILVFAILLLSVCIFAIGIEAWYNHTVSSDINGWSLYIGAVTSLIGTACGLKWGINYTDRKFPQKDYDQEILNEDQ